MEKSYVEGFRNILRRVSKESNKEKYNLLFTSVPNEKEERILELCKKFWPESYSDRNVAIDDYKTRDYDDPKLAKKRLDEINGLLDDLGWDKL